MSTLTEPERLEEDPELRRVRRDRSRRKPVRRTMIVTHRWLSLVLGLVLLVECVSGAVLVYEPELHRALNADAYDVSGGPRTTSMADAVDTVSRTHPSFAATAVADSHGVYAVTDFESAWTVDPATGRVLGHVDQDPAWVRFLANLHECGLTCEGQPGTLSWLEKPVPHTAWLSADDEAPEDLAVGDLALGVLGLLLLYLCLTGLWLWFPRPGRWRGSMSVRWRRGRFPRDTDLHKVAGMLALVPLLMWAVTGAAFYLGPIKSAWYALTPGGEQHESPAPDGFGAKGAPGAPAIGLADAVRIAEAKVPGTTVTYVVLPPKADRATPYDVWLSSRHDPYQLTDYPGDVEVGVDQHTGAAQVQYGFTGQSTSQWLYDAWLYPVHSGFVVNGWWRSLWFVFGMSPLLLGVTGVSTWLVRRRAKRRRAQRRQSSAAGSGRVGNSVG